MKPSKKLQVILDAYSESDHKGPASMALLCEIGKALEEYQYELKDFDVEGLGLSKTAVIRAISLYMTNPEWLNGVDIDTDWGALCGYMTYLEEINELTGE